MMLAVVVIPGQRAALNPKPMNTDHPQLGTVCADLSKPEFMGSAFAPVARLGMTE